MAVRLKVKLRSTPDISPASILALFFCLAASFFSLRFALLNISTHEFAVQDGAHKGKEESIKTLTDKTLTVDSLD
jgi:hypothetical protein